MTAIAGILKIGRPVRQRTTTHATSAGSADEQEDVVHGGGGHIAMQQVVGHPEPAARGAVPSCQQLERACRKDEVGAVRIGKTHVGQAATEQRARPECAVQPGRPAADAAC